MQKIAITVGQFIPRKGIDILIKAWAKCPKNYQLYIIGSNPTKEYLDLQQYYKLNNIHFVGFKSKSELMDYYKAADLFVFPTREDIWGLVVNEAMANGLPIITTNKCVAGLELVKEGENGYIVPVEDEEALYQKIILLLSDDDKQELFANNSLRNIRKYSVEAMAVAHMKALYGEKNNG